MVFQAPAMLGFTRNAIAAPTRNRAAEARAGVSALVMSSKTQLSRLEQT